MSANLDAKGAHIWREFMRRLTANPLGLPLGPQLPVSLNWLTQFSASDPVNTPRDLNILNPLVQSAFGEAVTAVQSAGFAPDTPMRDMQHPKEIQSNIPIFGGEGFEGAFTISVSGPISDEGYEVDYGNSYIQTVTWNSSGPVAEGFVTYSLSTDPASPHFADMTKEYSAKRWIRFPFHADEIQQQKISSMEMSTGAGRGR
jgi:acyl-homoserine-lactone acylase